MTRSNRPNRRISQSRTLSLHRPRPLPASSVEWLTAAVALALLAVGLLWR